MITGKEALIALANGEEVEVKHPHDNWFKSWTLLNNIGGKIFLSSMLNDDGYQFRLKPRTVNLNGVDVGQLKTSVWCRNYPKEVTLEFKTEDDAHYFYANAMKIFNGV